MTNAFALGSAAIALFGVISGRKMLTSCDADSYLSAYTDVTSLSPLPAPPPATTGEPCCLASASGTILVTPSPSIAAKPCSRRADRSVGYTADLGTGRAETMLITPFTRGSTTKLRPVISDTALTTASMSALTKLSVTVSSAPKAGDTSTRLANRNARSRSIFMGMEHFGRRRGSGQ